MKLNFNSRKCIFALAVIAATIYGGTKPPPASTNVPPDSAGGATNAPPSLMTALRPRQEPTAASQPPNAVHPWSVRGAWCDWRHITLPDTFAFPVGTNFVRELTLMSWGELRRTLADPTPLASLPVPVSLEPDVSSFAYGLTASNSFLFAWTNCCADRNPTNRIDASIELFESGEIAVNATSADPRSPSSTFHFQFSIPPPGFVGVGQDEAWLAAAFPEHFSAITNLGYDAWLDGYVGHNEPNGRFKLTVTIDALPERGPCYLYCGPFRTVIREPGSYAFPLVDLTEYDVYTAPTAVPLSFAYDDGWDPAPPSDFPTPLMAAGAPSSPNGHRYKIDRFPEVFIRPNFIPLSEALDQLIEIRCNAAGIAARDYTSFSGQARIFYGNPTEAEIQEAAVQDIIHFHLSHNEKTVTGNLYIGPRQPCTWWWWHYLHPGETNDFDYICWPTNSL